LAANGTLSAGSDITLRLPSSLLEYLFGWFSLLDIATYIVISHSHGHVGRNALQRVTHIDISSMSTMVRHLLPLPHRLTSLTISQFTHEHELDQFKMAIVALITANNSTLRILHIIPEEVIGSLLFIAVQGCRLLETFILPRVSRHDTNYSDVLVPISQTCPKLTTFGVESGIATVADIMEFVKSDLKLKEFKFR
jgi:hypothetical protein